MQPKKAKAKLTVKGQPQTETVMNESSSVEYKIEQCLIRGLSPSEIIDKLSLSKQTYWEYITRIRESSNKQVAELCADNMMSWLLNSYRVRLQKLWNMHDTAKDEERSLRLSCLRMIREEEEQLVTVAGKLGFFSEGSDELNEYMKNLYNVLSVLSQYQRDRILEVILKCINTQANPIPIVHEVKKMEE